MKTFLKSFVSIIIIAFAENLFAQNHLVIPKPLFPTLYLIPSPKQIGLGMSGTSLPSEDPSGFYYNPAQLGYIGQTNDISFQFYPSTFNSLGINTVNYDNKSYNIGYNFGKLLGGINLSAGFGYIHSNFDYQYIFSEPNFPQYSEKFDTYEKFDACGLGIGIDYYVQLNFGITYKNFYWRFTAYPYGTTFPNNVQISNDYNNSDEDYGLLLTIPVTKLINPQLQFPLYKEEPAFPYLNISVGYARLNMGDEIFYTDPNYADPMSTIARLGYTVSTGINIRLNNSLLKAISYDFTVDADDNLVEIDSVTYARTYKGLLGDIKIGRNLLGLKSDNNVVVHKGHNIGLFETVSFQIGRFGGREYYNDKSSGIGIQTKGIFTALKGFTKNNILNFIANHLDIQYYSSQLFTDSSQEIKFEGINLVWYGMML